MILDGSKDFDRRLKMMLHWDVNNGIARRSWARNEPATFAIKCAIKCAIKQEPRLKVTLSNLVGDDVIEALKNI